MIKRKERDKMAKKKLDLSKPIDITIFGSENDPCFGKHHSFDAAECGVCGDSQICQIIVSQMTHKKREELSKTQAFIDLEEQNVLKLPILESMIVKRIKDSPLKYVRLSSMRESIAERFNADKKISPDAIKQAVRDTIRQSKLLVMTKNEKAYLIIKLR